MKTLDIVNIYCDRGHREDPADVAAYTREDGRRWTLTGAARVDPRVPGSPNPVSVEHQTLAADKPVTAPTSSAEFDRTRDRLRCRHCNYTIPTRRERMEPVLDKIAEGLSEPVGRVLLWEHTRIARVPLAGIAPSIESS